MTKEISDFIDDFVKALKERNAVVFAGAGMSVASGYFDWKKLMTPVANKLGLNIDEEYDLTMLAQFFVDSKKGRGDLNQILIEEFSKAGIKRTENHEILARLPIQIYWTTNFDDLIEGSLKAEGKTPDVKRNQDDLSLNLPRRDAIVYKMHGDVTDISKVVLTKHDYEDYYKNRELLSNAFKADFVSRTMLFIGFSFTDPNLDYLISRIRTIQGENKKPDYYFIREEVDEQKRRRQKIRADSLMQYGLRPLWIRDYSEITTILREIERRLLRNVILISGSAASYGEWKDSDAQMFIHNLSKQLADKNLKIVSGFGLGVGSAVINGVLENMSERNNQNLDEYLILRPFPQYATAGMSIEATWRKYREQFIPLAGVAIFIFGNKLGDKDIVLADGMRQEFEIAVSKGLVVIPIGSTGFMAKELFDLLIKDFEKYLPNASMLAPYYAELDTKAISPDKLIVNVLKIIETLNQ